MFRFDMGGPEQYSLFANSKRWATMTLKPQDLFVLLKLVTLGPRGWTYSALAHDLGMSPSEVHAAIRRTLAARLAVETASTVEPVVSALQEFLAHGLQYVFVPERGALTRGMPTAHAAAPLRDALAPSEEPPPVWPDPGGETRGQAFSPLYGSAPEAARRDAGLYELLSLVDAVRGGRARERNLALKFLGDRLRGYGAESRPKS